MLLEPFGLAELAAAGGVAGTLGGRGRQRFRYSISPAGEKQQHSTGCAGSRGSTACVSSWAWHLSRFGVEMATQGWAKRQPVGGREGSLTKQR